MGERWGSMAVKKRRILYIEDKIEMINLTRIFLRQIGIEVLGALRGSEGLELIRREKPDLVLLDLVLPGMNGWDVYQQMQTDEALAHIPVIFVTASMQSNDEVSKLKQATSVVDYITKPFTPRVLKESIKRAFVGIGDSVGF